MSWLWGRSSGSKTNQSSADAILRFHENLQMLEKKEAHLEKQIEEQQNIAKKNAVSNKRVAMAALKRKKALEAEVEKIYGTRNTVEQQKAALESAHFNAEIFQSMRNGSDAMKKIHKSMKVEDVDKVMDDIREQQATFEDISNMISTPLGANADIDEDELQAEIDELQQEQLDQKMLGAERPPVHVPSGLAGNSEQVNARPATTTEDDDIEADLERMKAEMAM